MLKKVFYGPHEMKPWYPGTGYVDKDAKSLKSYRSREPQSIWQSLQAKTEDPGEYNLYICKFCFLYTAKADDIPKHERLCRYRNGPPGKLKYEDKDYKIMEVQIQPEHNGNCGSASAKAGGLSSAEPVCSSTEPASIKLYLQCLSLFGHLFLDTKSICFCVDAFLFYVAFDKAGDIAAGFFSKERHSWHDYNLACIVTFPPWQNRGLGQRLIAFSYLLSQSHGRYGSPEKPLSKHGKTAYQKYWRQRLIESLCANVGRNARNQKLTLEKLAKETGIDPIDLADTLRSTGALGENRSTVNLGKLMK